MSVIQIQAGKKSTDEGPINPIAEAKRLRTTPEKAKIARERKIQTNPASKKRCTRGQNDLNRNKTNLKVQPSKKKNQLFGDFFEMKQLFKNIVNKIETFSHFYRQRFGKLSATCG